MGRIAPHAISLGSSIYYHHERASDATTGEYNLNGGMRDNGETTSPEVSYRSIVPDTIYPHKWRAAATLLP